MDVLWGDDPNKPEDGVEYNVKSVRGAKGDLLVISPGVAYKARRAKPRGQWIELHPDKQFDTITPQLWANNLILKEVGVIAGFDFNLCVALANMVFEKKLQRLEAHANIAFVNGPNLNLLGTREPEIYGKKTLQAIFEECKAMAPNCNFVFRQSNSEGEIVSLIQKLRDESDAIIVNAGGYTHTSVAIHDALRTYDDQIIELHLSNPHQREDFRKTSYVAPVADSLIAGFGATGYKLALIAACARL